MAKGRNGPKPDRTGGTKRKRVKPVPGVQPDEAREIAALRKALEPVLARGLTHYRIASAAGAHPEDMRGFLEGRVSLTYAVRERLRAQIPDLMGENKDL